MNGKKLMLIIVIITLIIAVVVWIVGQKVIDNLELERTIEAPQLYYSFTLTDII